MKKDQKYLDNLRHTASHLLAAAVMELWPDTKRTIGPAIENGFYYDFDFGGDKISDDDLPKIEDKMRELLPAWIKFEKIDETKDSAQTRYPENQYKNELIQEIVAKGGKITSYKSGDFIDLCRGGHLENPAKELRAFKLLSVAGAYWRGDENNKMLTRIYGTAFPTQEELDQYLVMLEEAKKRDHRKLGKELDLFAFSDLVGSGLPLFTPKGTILREELKRFSEELREKRGFQKVWVPHITKIELYKKSGHWDKFGDELFIVESQETSDELVMKPMNCPHHQQLYASRPRSYRDLPIKYLETTSVYRDEKTGELLGLSRVRSITQDDSHTFCTPEQIETVYQELIDITKEFYEILGMKYRARVSLRDPDSPEKYLGDEKLWQQAQDILIKIAQKSGIDYYEAEGEAAFYGPKIDFMVTDALGREWQLATPQLDFVQPARFGLTYRDKDGSDKTPVMIHYALLGSTERFLSVYIEHTAGLFPVWLSPVQTRIIPISEKFNAYGEKVLVDLKNSGVRVELDSSDETLGKRIRNGQAEKIPYLVIVGEKEEKNKSINVRKRGEEEQKEIKLEEFANQIQKEIREKVLWPL
jgi:threonyl-tRNA synthetase